MKKISREQKIHFTLRVAVAMCFIGHGMCGVITKSIWCNYFAVFGIGAPMAYRLMPLVGAIDILLGVITLLYPTRAALLWLVAWGFFTAWLRPLAGEPFAEVIERAGNFGVPLAFLFFVGGGTSIKHWFTRLPSDVRSDQKIFSRVVLCLKIVAFLLLFGHGWLNAIEKKSLLDQYASLGFLFPVATAHAVGIMEMLAACFVLIRPLRPMVLGILIWKMSSELFYPHLELIEWIERGGSYGALCALWIALPAAVLKKNEWLNFFSQPGTAALQLKQDR